MIVSGKVSPKEAVWVFVALTLTAFFLVLFMNKLTIYLSFVGAALAATGRRELKQQSAEQ